MFYNARYYSPYLNRWLQPDVIVPDGEKASIIPLTVSYHELPLLAQLNAENAFTLRHGHWPQLSAAEKREAKINRGPLNPQALNRYSYVMENPLRYTDPTGHEAWCTQNYTVCTGATITNNSSKDIWVKGDLLLADGSVLRDQIFLLRSGQSSIDIGMIDVDDVIDVAYDDSDQHSRGLGLRTPLRSLKLTDGNAYTATDCSGSYCVNTSSDWKSLDARQTFGSSTGHADISRTRFVGIDVAMVNRGLDSVNSTINSNFNVGYRDCTINGGSCGLPRSPSDRER